MTSVLNIENLKVTFATDAGDVPAVKDVSLTVAPGEVVAIVGESGSGKSVTAKTILGLLPETAVARGAVILGANNVIELSGARLRAVRGTDVAMVFQEPSTALNPVYTVGWQIAEGLRAHGKYTKKQARAKAIEILGKVGIPDPKSRVDYYPHQFSGGQKQRVVIAMALVLEPGLIVADEPTTALDVTVQAEILDLLRRLREELGLAVIIVTHDLGVIADLCDRAVVMYAGQVIEQGSVDTLLTTPTHPYTRALLASMPSNAIPGLPLDAIPGAVPAPRDWPEGCRFAPRCAFATDACRSAPVPIVVQHGGLSRCIRVDEVLAASQVRTKERNIA